MPKIVPLFPGQQKPQKEAQERFTRRKDGLYQLEKRYQLPDGTSKKKSFYGKTQSEALEKRRIFERDLEEGRNVPHMDMTVSAWVERWLAARKRKYKGKPTMRTYNTHKREADRLVEAVGGKRLRDIVRSDIESIMDTRAGMSKTAIKQTFHSIRSIFEAARGDRIITYNPCDGVELPEGTRGSHRALSADERDFIVSTWNGHRVGFMAMLMLFAGLRRGEALALKWEDIDDTHISIRRAVAYDINQPIEKDTKTTAGERRVPIVAPLRIALDEYKKSPHPKAYVCTSVDENQYTQSAFERGWQSYLYYLSVIKTGCEKNWCERKGIEWNPVVIRTHDLRHTFCTMLYDAGVDVKRTQELMGHKDLSVTMKIYTHLSDEKRAKSDESMQKYFDQVGHVGKTVGKARRYRLKKS